MNFDICRRGAPIHANKIISEGDLEEGMVGDGRKYTSGETLMSWVIVPFRVFELSGESNGVIWLSMDICKLGGRLGVES